MFTIDTIVVGTTTYTSWDAAAEAIGTSLRRSIERATRYAHESLNLTLRKVVDDLITRNGVPWPLSGDMFGTSKDSLASRSGDGIRSIRDSLRVKLDTSTWEVAGEISTANLTIHELGGTLRPTQGRYLAIPLRAAVDSKGLPLKSNPRDWDNTFVHKAKSGSLFIFRKDRGTLVPLYLLKSSVYVPPRLRMKETIDDNLPYFLTRVIDAYDREFAQ